MVRCIIILCISQIHSLYNPINSIGSLTSWKINIHVTNHITAYPKNSLHFPCHCCRLGIKININFLPKGALLQSKWYRNISGKNLVKLCMCKRVVVYKKTIIFREVNKMNIID